LQALVVLLLLLLQKLLQEQVQYYLKDQMLPLEVHQQQVRELVHQQQVQMLKVQRPELEQQMGQLGLVVILPPH
jgi:hypothetical protein